MLPRLPCATVAVLCFAACYFPAMSFADDVDVTGDYRCEGTGPGGTKYFGVASIVKKVDVYIVQWTFAKETYSGTGILENGMLSVGWIRKDGVSGVIAYRIKDDSNTLDGKWTINGGGKVYREQLTRREANSRPPSVAMVNSRSSSIREFIPFIFSINESGMNSVLRQTIPHNS